VPATDLHVVMVDQTDPRLGRQCVQDPRSRAFPMAAPDTSTWRSKTIRMYDPTPNPNQTIGDCTGCDKAMEGNAAGNRVSGRILTMADAEQIYSLATELDPWAAIQLKLGGAYRWNFTHDASGIVQEIMEGRTVGVGTWWYEGGFRPKPRKQGGVYVEMTGAKAGGHQWRIRGYDEPTDMLLGRCWWGRFRDFWITRTHLAELLADDGDAVTQVMVP
jgi:hypothetical protein